MRFPRYTETPASVPASYLYEAEVLADLLAGHRHPAHPGGALGPADLELDDFHHAVHRALYAAHVAEPAATPAEIAKQCAAVLAPREYGPTLPSRLAKLASGDAGRARWHAAELRRLRHEREREHMQSARLTGQPTPTHPNAPAWDDSCLPRDGRGRIPPAPEALGAILSRHPDWEGVLTRNLFSGAIETRRVPPWHPDDAPPDPLVGEWQDNDTLRAASWISRRYGAQGLRPTKTAVEDAVQLVADRLEYHPVRDYLRALRWDGVSRLETWLGDYFGADQTAYTSLVGRLWLISAVARVMRPGCVAKYVLVLEGAQDLGKSTAIRRLGAPWVRDTPLDLDSKDAYTGLRGAWIVELAELDGMNRHETARVKSFLSSPEDRFRPPYGRRDVTVPRQSVFVGTINPDAGGRYLKDPTGAVRFWPVACASAEIDALASVRDQLWAEAAAAYAQGARWWPEGAAEHALCRAEQEARAVEDERADLVAAWLETAPALQLRAADGLTPAAIALGALGIPPERLGRAEQTVIGQIMQSLGGWARFRRGPRDARGYVYRRD